LKKALFTSNTYSKTIFIICHYALAIVKVPVALN